MFVATMLDAFPQFIDEVTAATGSVLPQLNAVLSPCTKAGIAARRFTVPEQNKTVPIHYPEMDRMLAGADLSELTRNHARAMLRLLAKAESKVHGKQLEQVHFHEIADWDTLADLTAAAALIGLLDGWNWSFDPLPLGGGTVRTAHGHLPVPAPAAAHLLEGLAVQDDGIEGERVTPTGAAIVRYIADQLTLRSRPMGRLQAIGYGAGTRDLPGLANVVVVQVISGVSQSGDTVSILEWDIDDMTGEEIAVASDHLRSFDGVLDLVTLAMTGKKGRHVTGFRVMAEPAHTDAVAQAVFAQTTTLGLRLRQDQRLILLRVARPGAKVAVRPAETTSKAESDAVADLPTLAARRARARKEEL